MMDSFFDSLVLKLMPVLVTNSSHAISSWNQELEKLYGWTQQEALGKDAHLLLKTVFPLPIDQIEHQLFENGKWTGELIRTNKDGQKIYLSSHAVVQRNEQGGILTIYELDHEITEQKRLENALRESEEGLRTVRTEQFHIEETLREFEARYRDLFENSVIGISQTLPDGRLIAANVAFAHLYGYTDPQELLALVPKVGEQFYANPKDREDVLHILGEKGFMEPRELAVIHRDRTRFYVLVSAREIRDSKGSLYCYQAEHIDITEQKQAEERVHEAYRFAQDTIDAIKAHICVLAENGNILNVNQAWRDFADANPPAPANYCIGMNYLDVCDRAEGLNSAEAIPFAAGLRAVIKGDIEQFTMEYPCNDPNKENRWFSAQITQFAAGNPQRIVVAHENITGRKLAELKIAEYTAQLRSLSQRQSELQEIERRNIARELHDEVGQVMTAVKTNLETIKLSPVPATLNNQLVESISIVDRALDQIRTIALNLRPSLLDDFGLEAALEWYLERMARGTSYIIKFKSNMSEIRLPPAIETTCFRVVQGAMTNILRHSRATRVDVSLYWSPKAKTVKLSVRDNGIGFDVTAALERARHGESLGLLGMQERVQLVGGQIELVSAPGRGTKVLVSIPVIAEA
jgi:PAS domain S-box-containing protein